MVDLKLIIGNLYAGQSPDLFRLLDEHSMLDPIRRSIIQLNALLVNQHVLAIQTGSLPVGHIAANLLQTVNSYLAKQQNMERTGELEQILSDICIAILENFLHYLKGEKRAVVAQLDYALKDTCEFHNYDYNRLVSFLQLKERSSYIQTLRKGDRVLSKSIPSLCWNGEARMKADFIDLFVDHELVRSRKRLHLLFDVPDIRLNLAFDSSKAKLTLQFFHHVKQTKLVSYAGCKGFYEPLQYHIPGFQKDFLENRKPGRQLEALKQSKQQWNENQQRIAIWLKPFLPPELFSTLVSGTQLK